MKFVIENKITSLSFTDFMFIAAIEACCSSQWLLNLFSKFSKDLDSFCMLQDCAVAVHNCCPSCEDTNENV